MPIDPLLAAVPRASSAPGDVVAGLYRVHRRRLAGLAAAVTLDRGVADEIVQEAFAGLTARFADVRDPLAYLQRSVVNAGIGVVRRRERARRAPQRPVPALEQPELGELWELVVALAPQPRAVVALRFWEDLSHQQIAAVLELPVGTVKSTLHRALARLKDQL